MSGEKEDADLPAYSDTGYSDNLDRVTLLADHIVLKSVTVVTYLVTVTLLPGTQGVTVNGGICIRIM